MARSRKIKRRRLPRRGGGMPTPKSWSSGQSASDKRQKNQVDLVNSANKHSQEAVDRAVEISNVTRESNIDEVRGIDKMIYEKIVPVRNMVNTVKQLPSLPTKFREELAERNTRRTHKPLIITSKLHVDSSEVSGLPSQAYVPQAQVYESQARSSQPYESQEASAPIFTGGRRISRRHYGGNMPVAEGFAEGQVVARQKKLNQLAQTQYATAQADGSVAQSSVAVAETVGAVPGSLQDTLPKAAAIQSTKAKSQASSAQIMIAPFVRAEEAARQAAIAEAEARARAQALAEQQALAEAATKARTQIQEASNLTEQLLYAQYQQNMIALYTYNNIDINTKRVVTDFVNAVLKGPQDMANVAATYLNQMGERRTEYSRNLANIIINNPVVAMAIASQGVKYDEAIMNLNIANRGVIPALEQNVPSGFQIRQQMGGYRKMRGGVSIEAVTLPQKTREELNLEKLSNVANTATVQSKLASTQASLAVQHTLGAKPDSLEYRMARQAFSNSDKSSAESSSAISITSQRVPEQMKLIQIARKASLLTGILPEVFDQRTGTGNPALINANRFTGSTTPFYTPVNPMEEGTATRRFADDMNKFFKTEDPQVMANYGRALLETITKVPNYINYPNVRDAYCANLARFCIYSPYVAACVGCQSIRYNSMAMKVVNIPSPSNRFTAEEVYNAILPYIPISQSGGYKRTRRTRRARQTRKTSRK